MNSNQDICATFITKINLVPDITVVGHEIHNLMCLVKKLKSLYARNLTNSFLKV